METAETLDTMQARHRKEQRDLQSRVTSKKKNATKKNRKGINDECATLERELKERQQRELDVLSGVAVNGDDEVGDQDSSSEKNDAPEGTEEKTVKGVTQQLKQVRILDPQDGQKQQHHPDSPAEGPSTQSSQQHSVEGAGGGGGGKKRNRQKERMARRAAEQEAEAEKAASEASGMTDHRGIERAALERAFETNGLVEHEIMPDGHCLFAAVADQLALQDISLSSPSSSSPMTKKSHEGGDGEGEGVPPYKTVRRVATAYMASHADDFAPFLEEPLDAYVAKIRDTAEWGGQLELMAIARAYGVEIKVVQNGRTETIGPGEGGEGEGDAEGERKKKKNIWLAYYRHGYGLGEHYNSLRKKGQA